MSFDFDRVIDRRASDSNKWRKYPADVLPLWVADMDFPSPPAVVQVLRARVEQGFFGYLMEKPELHEVVANLRAHRDETRRECRKPPFEQPEAQSEDGVEVPTQHVAVKGMHDDPGPRPSCQECRDASDGSGLGRMRVQDARPVAADEPCETEDRSCVPER